MDDQFSPLPSTPAWKDQLRQRFEEALASLPDPPEGWDNAEEPDITPDIFQFYEELAALRNEYRQANRRAAETFTQFGDSLGNLDGELAQLRRQLQTSSEKTNSAPALTKTRALSLIEIADKIDRLLDQLNKPPQPKESFFSRTPAEWPQAWEGVRAAVEIFARHVQGLLADLEIRPLSCLGQPFDPTNMQAVARDTDSQAAANTVTEEITRGYLWQGKPLRLADVKVNTRA